MTSNADSATDSALRVSEIASNLRKLGENANFPLGAFMDPDELGEWLDTNDDVTKSMRQWCHQATIYMAHWLRRQSGNFTAKHGHTAWRQVKRFLVPGSAESAAWSELTKFQQWDVNLCAEKIAEWRRDGIVLPVISGAEVAYVIDDGGFEVATELFTRAEMILKESRRPRPSSQETLTNPARSGTALCPQLPITIDCRINVGGAEVVAKCRGKSTAVNRISMQIFATLDFFRERSKVNALLTGTQQEFYRAFTQAIGGSPDASADHRKFATLCRKAISRTNRQMATVLRQLGIERARIIETLPNAGYRLSEQVRIRDPLSDEDQSRSGRNPRMGRAIVSSPIIEASRSWNSDDLRNEFEE